uniref:V-SNARE coiled-coil homology domain-containing protein n=1 Tax=Strigamia maritima TaxID=126957 RepID=T1JHU2_STRMM
MVNTNQFMALKKFELTNRYICFEFIMVKLYSISILYKTLDSKAITLKSAYELSSFGFFQKRGSLCTFTSQIVVERTPASVKSSIREQDYLCHVFVRSDNLAGVVVTDHEYPPRVAHTLLIRLLDEFAAQVPFAQWTAGQENSIQFKALDVYLTKYQNPREIDAMSKIQADLDETKIILHNTIEAVLQRGEKLDDLVVKSEELSLQSKTFYKTAKKTNSCCTIL